jgi:hypothetical protein
MIAYIALVLSILNTIFWVLFVITIKKVFKQLYPVVKSLTGMPDYATMSVPPKIGDH